MRRLFSTFILLMIGVAVLGYCREWFSVSTTDNPLGDQIEVNLHIDKLKIRQDARQAKEAVRSLHREVADMFDDADEPAGNEFNR
jgi:hypothetical protein